MSAPGMVDLRRFRWPLAPLQRKLEWDLEAARVRLARRQRDAREAAARVDHLEAARSEQAAAARMLQDQGHAQAYLRGLAYLSGLGGRIAEALRSRQHAEAQAGQARAECLACQRRLDVLLAAREGALDEHVREALRRQAKEADAAWLALRSGAPARHLEGEA